MLKISEMAQLANTTRRTLIFYDQEGIFKPAQKNAQGYRYYRYDQVYDLLFILSLRDLDIPLAEIKTILNQPDGLDVKTVSHYLQLVEQKLAKFEQIKQILKTKLSQSSCRKTKPVLYQPKLAHQSTQTFWCSQQVADCSEPAIAELFSSFYHDLDQRSILTNGQSGFLTKLAVNQGPAYPQAAFRLLKEVGPLPTTTILPKLEKPAGRYVQIYVENTLAGIERGLADLTTYAQNQSLSLSQDLWQLNDGTTFVHTGATQFGWLAYQVTEANN